MSIPWWEKPLRVYQPNLRLIDGMKDPKELVDEAQYLSANLRVVNAGGAFAFYNTNLDCQVAVSPLNGDLFDDVLQIAHDRDIRVVARLEVSVKLKRSTTATPTGATQTMMAPRY